MHIHKHANYVKLVELSAENEKKTISRKAAKIDKELKRANQSINQSLYSIFIGFYNFNLKKLNNDFCAWL